MTYNFGDGFDLYFNGADFTNGYWDAASLNPSSSGVGTGRFAGSRCLVMNTPTTLQKTSGVNDAVHHFVLGFQCTNITGTGAGCSITLMDGATNQCSIVFRNDGAILLTAGAWNSTTLATWPAAFTVNNTWYAFEFEVVINNTTGRFRIRKNGNTVDDFDTGAGLNTRNGSTNNYANAIQIRTQNQVQNIDDFYWRSDASAVAWIGDMRCYTRMPRSDIQHQFTPVGQRPVNIAGAGGTVATANRAFYWPATMPCDGTVSAIAFGFNGSPTYIGNTKMAVFADAGTGFPGALIASAASVITNPPNANVNFTFSPPITVTFGQVLWIGVCPDTSASFFTLSSGSGGWWGTVNVPPYASWPPNPPTGLATAVGTMRSVVYIDPSNSGEVSEAQQDGLTTYVYDSNPGDSDLYTIAPISPSSPIAVIAVVSRGYMTKNDAGTRTSSLQIKSGSTTVTTPPLTMSPNGWQWNWRMDITDPNTGAAWTTTAVDSLQIGPVVAA